jgi:hypothetical protein
MNYCVLLLENFKFFVDGREGKSFFPSNYLADFHYIAGLEIDNVAVRPSANATLVERHDVLRQRARFVGENVLNLAELLVERRGAGFRESFGLLVEHLLVPVNLK